jgi:hypothetical protein
MGSRVFGAYAHDQIRDESVSTLACLHHRRWIIHRSWGTFVSRGCPYFKVDVTFHRATGPSSDTRGKDVLRDLDNDVIASISRPYLEFSVLD